MIVYGDPSTRESMAALVARLEESLATAEPDALDARRVRLILAGQLEQAVEDGLPEHAAACRLLTDAAACSFVAAWAVSQGRPAPGRDMGGAQDFENALARVPRSDLPLAVKLPEGFAFYGLYPEAYAVAALRWLESPSPWQDAGRGEGDVLIVGVRSIGTALSAVVAATLRSGGFAARRITVRPTGHPFAREASLPRVDAAWALVVDEGPGLSGSSMASVAEALVRGGFPRGRIAFFPGHGGEPGAQASESVRAWWRETPRYVVGTEDLRWDGLTLEETLMARTEGGFRVEEMSGGAWRAAVYRDPAEWPAVASPFERRKLRVARRDGSAALWKFTGLVEPLSPRGERGREGPLGFQPSGWVEGEPLRREDVDPAALGRHILAVAGPPLSSEEAEAARDRLEEMLRVNLGEAGLPNLSPVSAPGGGGPSAGAYRLAPWEWRRLPSGEIVKAGRIAPTGDHTVVGRQPLAWDVAGAMVEWGLDDPTDLPPIPPDALRFYRLAYAAFRMGQCAMFAGPGEEGKRLARAAAFYRTALKGVP